MEALFNVDERTNRVLAVSLIANKFEEERLLKIIMNIFNSKMGQIVVEDETDRMRWYPSHEAAAAGESNDI